MLRNNHQRVALAAYTACLQDCLFLYGDRRATSGLQGYPFTSGQKAKSNVTQRAMGDRTCRDDDASEVANLDL